MEKRAKRDTRFEIYIDRLVKEWETYNSIIIGVDFDSTLSPWNTIDNGSDIQRTVELLKQCKQTGCYIVIHTACNEDRYGDIKEYCAKIGLDIDTINQTPIDLPYGKNGSKPYCNHFLDDRGALPAALDILENALYIVIGKQQKHKTLYI